jgi:hypothetical protein
MLSSNEVALDAFATALAAEFAAQSEETAGETETSEAA